MGKHMTISDAVDAFDLYDFFNEILDAYETDFYARSEIDTELRDLIEEHEETYEFIPDEDGEWAESLERNLREALGMIFEEHGVEHLFDDEFSDEAMDDEDIAGIYNDGLEEDEMAEDGESGFEEDDTLF